ncbi:hypothetical protein [Neptuniibacter pectenicola]|uniref:hypothetical protein n=1 Tax=Neptuniibacter pectenicola TaxID=1806669 RepID=UPI00082D0659|nr:hypothetical protein [Neptuniibacter pectenicola]
MEIIIDYFFKFSVVIVIFSTLFYLYFGRKLAISLSILDRDAWISLGRPKGLYTFTFHNTELIDCFLDEGKHLTSYPKIRALGELVLSSRRSFNLSSWSCIACFVLEIIVN